MPDGGSSKGPLRSVDVDAGGSISGDGLRGHTDPTADRRTLAVLSSGLSQPSSTAWLATRLGETTARVLQRQGISVAVRTIELRPHATALTESLVHARLAPQIEQVIEAVTEADALIAVTPTFAASYAGLFKSFFDLLDPDSLTGMPVLLGATGGSARHSLVIEYAMRPLLNYFRATIVPTGVFAAAEDFDGPVTGRPGTRLVSRIERAAGELAVAMVGGASGGAVPRTAIGSSAETIGDATRPGRWAGTS